MDFENFERVDRDDRGVWWLNDCSPNVGAEKIVADADWLSMAVGTRRVAATLPVARGDLRRCWIGSRQA